jgi:hypothetical protein
MTAERAGSRTADAKTLRSAAAILEARAGKQTFALRVVVKVLRKHADRIAENA